MKVPSALLGGFFFLTDFRFVDCPLSWQPNAKLREQNGLASFLHLGKNSSHS
jgi:hypothetical protein